MEKQWIKDYINNLSSSNPAPGGGSVAAFEGALASSLFAMVFRLTLKNNKYNLDEKKLNDLVKSFDTLTHKFLRLSNEDIDAFERVSLAYKLPKANDEEKEIRKSKIKEETIAASIPPLNVIDQCSKALEMILPYYKKLNKNTTSDLITGIYSLSSAVKGAYANVLINLCSYDDLKIIKTKEEARKKCFKVIEICFKLEKELIEEIK